MDDNEQAERDRFVEAMLKVLTPAETSALMDKFDMSRAVRDAIADRLAHPEISDETEYGDVLKTLRIQP